VSFQMSVVITEENNVVVKSEKLFGTTISAAIGEVSHTRITMSL
jgi:hypothetical protein